jgi:hypothetical protein
MQETEQDPKEAVARADGRIPAEDTRVGMSELEAIWAGQRARGEIFNGCTSVALVERYGDRVYHVMGVGWFVRPDIATDAADAEGHRVCGPCGANGQRAGEIWISWDDDADQEYALTPAVCGYCGADVLFDVSGETWNVSGRLATEAEGKPFTCLSSPDGLHDPAHPAAAQRAPRPQGTLTPRPSREQAA